MASSRWRFLFVPATSLILLACHGTASFPAAPADSVRVVALPPAHGQLVQVIAHPDDDILFMNPDLAASIHSGQPTTSIYLTGGESSMPNPAGYAAQRQEGTRAAYAHMAGVPNDWTRQVIPAGNRMVETDHLTARPDLRIVFLNVPEDNNPAAAGGKHALTRLFNGQAAAVNTLVPDTGTVRDSVAYRRADVVNVLVELFARFRPTVVRAQDPQPDSRYQSQWGGFHDHPDHVVAARFTQEALQRYTTEHPETRAALVQYRDYNIADAPINLAEADQARKKDYFAAYLPHDSEANLGGSYKDWTERSYYRWTRGGRWADRDAQGEIHAFAVDGPQLTHWWRTPDGSWQGPETSPAPEPLRPTVTVLADRSGRLILLAQRMDGRSVLVKRQLPGGTWPPQWSDIGSPQPQGEATAEVGVPTAAIDGAGCLAVLLKNAGGGVSIRREATPGSGEWEPGWNDLGGTDVQDGVTVAPGNDNLLHVFASTRERVLHWQEQVPHGTFEQIRSPFRQIRPAGPPAAVREPGGRMRIFARTADNGNLAAVADLNPFWWQVPGHLSNPGGMSSPVVVAREGKTGPQSVVFVRNSAGGVSALRQEAASGQWADLGGPVLDQPAPVVESDGSITLLATGTDGRLLINQDTPRRSGLDFHGWRLAQP